MKIEALVQNNNRKLVVTETDPSTDSTCALVRAPLKDLYVRSSRSFTLLLIGVSAQSVFREKFRRPQRRRGARYGSILSIEKRIVFQQNKFGKVSPVRAAIGVSRFVFYYHRRPTSLPFVYVILNNNSLFCLFISFTTRAALRVLKFSSDSRRQRLRSLLSLPPNRPTCVIIARSPPSPQRAGHRRVANTILPAGITNTHNSDFVSTDATCSTFQRAEITFNECVLNCKLSSNSVRFRCVCVCVVNPFSYSLTAQR